MPSPDLFCAAAGELEPCADIVRVALVPIVPNHGWRRIIAGVPGSSPQAICGHWEIRQWLYSECGDAQDDIPTHDGFGVFSLA